ncbi:MAG: cytochrome c [Myxococcota bacterium]
MRGIIVGVSLGLLVSAGCGKGAEAPAGAAAEPAAAAAPAAAKPAEPAAVVELHDAGPPGDPEAGATVFKGTCEACHQKDGSGLGGALAANFNEPGRLAKPDSVLLHSIAEGFQGKTAVMPAHKKLLTEQQRKDALAYIRASFGPKK